MEILWFCAMDILILSIQDTFVTWNMPANKVQNLWFLSREMPLFLILIKNIFSEFFFQNFPGFSQSFPGFPGLCRIFLDFPGFP